MKLNLRKIQLEVIIENKLIFNENNGNLYLKKRKYT